ncbi:MAG TPA: ABC-F family ATP-binding cassette domain-containing protein [Methylomirabilota bacterium]|jgi:ATP-binding cassette subfamily F protein 3|nr:ABC-F family ATP-binding cassette domain-containing protein [Methylomirabilota bacterium]
MISVEGIAKSYGGQVLFRDLSWRIADRERIGLVGPNGVGKTTLCRILAGLEDPDAGQVSRPRATTVGYLAQEAAATAEGSVLGEALAGFADVWALEREMEEVAQALEATPSEALTARYGDLQHRFEALGGYRLESQAKAILSGLGFRPDELARPLTEFSGGWRMRAALARLLLVAPSLLLLDEPTNHLDLESLAWLENFLAGYAGTVVVVSHDRYFLNRMVTSIAELSPAGLTVYPGDYDDYLVEREARHALLEAQARNQAKRIEEIERFIERFRYQATKARQVQSRVKMLAKVERIEVPGASRRIHFKFPEPPRTGRRVATLAGIHKAYGDNVVYAGVDFTVERGERVALVGENGAGKSTLLKILAGALPFERGERTLGSHVAVHYYAQHQLDALTPTNTVLDELIAVAPDLQHTRLRTILGAFLFSGDSVEKKVSVLSGGEKARLALAKMLVRPAALLCMDEPTNHLDLVSREVLEAALAGFQGTIVFISHDRYFINRISTVVTHVAHGTLTRYLGGYDDYLTATASPEAAAAAAARAAAPTAVVPQRRRQAHERLGAGAAAAAVADRRAASAPPPPAAVARIVKKKSTAELKELRGRVQDIERKIEELERRIEDIGRSLSDPRLYTNGDRVRAITVERNEAVQALSSLMREWEQASTALSGHD